MQINKLPRLKEFKPNALLYEGTCIYCADAVGYFLDENKLCKECLPNCDTCPNQNTCTHPVSLLLPRGKNKKLVRSSALQNNRRLHIGYLLQEVPAELLSLQRNNFL